MSSSSAPATCVARPWRRRWFARARRARGKQVGGGVRRSRRSRPGATSPDDRGHANPRHRHHRPPKPRPRRGDARRGRPGARHDPGAHLGGGPPRARHRPAGVRARGVRSSEPARRREEARRAVRLLGPPPARVGVKARSLLGVPSTRFPILSVVVGVSTRASRTRSSVAFSTWPTAPSTRFTRSMQLGGERARSFGTLPGPRRSVNRERHLSVTDDSMSASLERLLARIGSGTAKVAVVGQGYVGLPVAMRAAEVGFAGRRVRHLDESASTRCAEACRTSRTCQASDLRAALDAGYLASRTTSRDLA